MILFKTGFYYTLILTVIAIHTLTVKLSQQQPNSTGTMGVHIYNFRLASRFFETARLGDSSTRHWNVESGTWAQERTGRLNVLWLVGEKLPDHSGGSKGVERETRERGREIVT
jgi:hypothetical protein